MVQNTAKSNKKSVTYLEKTAKDRKINEKAEKKNVILIHTICMPVHAN